MINLHKFYILDISRSPFLSNLFLFQNELYIYDFLRFQGKFREQDLLQASENGDVESLESLVKGGDLNFSCTDMLGRTPVQLAVGNEHQETVQFLLDYVDSRSVYEALLLAIKLGHDEIAEMILEHRKYEEINDILRRQVRTDWGDPCLCGEYYVKADKVYVKIQISFEEVK